MRIFVVGNINSGKSHIVNKLIKKYPSYNILSIDEFRKKHSDGSIEKEIQTRNIFANEIIKHKDSIIEFSGGNTITSLFVDKLRQNSVVILEVEENVNICLERTKSKDFSKIPYPTYSESLEDTIRRLDIEFRNNCIEKNFMNTVLQHYKVNSNDDINELPLDQFEITIKLVDSFENIYDCLFAFGSLGRREVKKYSDVDLFLKTANNVSIVEDQIKNIFPESEIIIQRNQIDAYINNHLLEINLIQDLKDAQLFYKKSEIKNVSNTILLGNEELNLSLENLLKNFNYDFKDEFTYTISRLKYYVNSLPRLILKNDLYKFYFHNNIIVHEYVKLVYFINGNRDYSYLPRHSYEMINTFIWKRLIFTFDKDQEEHYNVIKELTEDIILRAYEYLNNI